MHGVSHSPRVATLLRLLFACARRLLNLITHHSSPITTHLSPILFCQTKKVNQKSELRRHSHKFGYFIWWRRGESNPCPKSLPHESLRAQFPIRVSMKFRSETNRLHLFRSFSLCVTGRCAKVSCMVGILRARQAGAQRTLAIKPPRQNQILRLCLSTV